MSMFKDGSLGALAEQASRPLNDRREWIFTFGFGHQDADGSPLADHFVRIRGNYEEARAEMFRRFGRKWANQYETEDEAGVARFGLIEKVL